MQASKKANHLVKLTVDLLLVETFQALAHILVTEQRHERRR